MAELLLRVADKTSADPFKDAKLTKRGDVIVALPDGWNWTEEEQRNPAWRILKWPALSLSAASVFLSPELDTEPAQLGIENPMLQRRGFGLDLDAKSLPPAFAAWLADDTRAAPFFTVPAGITVTTLRKKKQARTNPNVIG